MLNLKETLIKRKGYRLRVKFINYEVKNELKKSETEKNNNGETEANKKTRLANLKFKNIVKKVGKPDLKQATKAAVKEMKLGNTAMMMLFQAATIAAKIFGTKVTFEKMKQASGLLTSAIGIVLYFLLREELRGITSV